MPTLANITLGVAEFKPANRDTASNTITYEDRSGGIPIGYPTLRIRKTANPSVRRDKFVLQVPRIQSAAAPGADGFLPAARLSHFNSVMIETVCSNVSTVAERQQVIDLATALVADALMKALVVDQEEITG